MPHVQYVTDTNGKPLYVQVPTKEYEKLLADAEELANIAAGIRRRGVANECEETCARVRQRQ